MKKSSLKVLFASAFVAGAVGAGSTVHAGLYSVPWGGYYNQIMQYGTNKFTLGKLVYANPAKYGLKGTVAFSGGDVQGFGFKDNAGKTWEFLQYDPALMRDVYRVFNKNSGEHFFTESSNEAITLQNEGWTIEGFAWEAPSTGATEKVEGQTSHFNHFAPVYRVYNPNSGEHVYTESNYEATSLAKIGWRKEGIAFNSGGNTPVYRLYNPKAGVGAHFVTMSSYEKSVLVKSGWSYEGIAWYATQR